MLDDPLLDEDVDEDEDEQMGAHGVIRRRRNDMARKNTSKKSAPKGKPKAKPATTGEVQPSPAGTQQP
jgi:hypothetical protein